MEFFLHQMRTLLQTLFPVTGLPAVDSLVLLLGFTRLHQRIRFNVTILITVG